MTITGLGLRPSFIGDTLLGVRAQIDDLQQQLATGKRADSYAGMGVDRGFAVGLRTQLSDLSSYADTISHVNTRLNIGSSVLERLVAIGRETKSAATGGGVQLDNTGQTMAQGQATAALAETLQLLNTQVGDRYLFSGRATDTAAVADVNAILDGNGTQAGLRQLIGERKLADVGAAGLGRLLITAPTATSVQVAEDVAGSPFGLKLNAVTSTLTGATVTGPAGVPPAASVNLPVNPANGEKIRFTFDLPDGSTEVIELTASTMSPPPAGGFAIGATSAATAANLQAALTPAISKLANGSLVAASALAASSNFFDASPPLRVNGPPFNSATALVAGTSTNTVTWYTGESGPDPARGTAVVRIDQAITVPYGARANEDALRHQLKITAAFAAVTTAATDPNAAGQVQALNERVSRELSVQSGMQTIQDIQSDFAGTQTAMNAASERQKLTKSMALSMLENIEGISKEEVAAKILTLHTNLQVSYQTTALLFQTSLAKFL